MNTKTLNDYTCFNEDDSYMVESDTLEQVLISEERRNAPKRKKNVRKAIERYFERKRLKNDINDFNLDA